MCTMATESVEVQQTSSFAAFYCSTKVVWNIRLRDDVFCLLESAWIFSHYINEIVPTGGKGVKPRAAFRSGRLAATADQVRQVGNERLACHVEPAAQVIPERDALLGTGLGQTEKSIAAVAADLAAGAGTDLAAGDVAADVV